MTNMFTLSIPFPPKKRYPNKKMTAIATTVEQERANTLTHALGLVLGLIAVPALLVWQYGTVSTVEWMSLLVFGITLLQVYATSTIYHALTDARWKFRMQVLDHISIYFLIAGTHTPLIVHYLPGETGRVYLLIIWSMAFAGLVYKLFFFGRWEWLSVGFYLVMGWMGVLTIPEMAPGMSTPTFYGIVLGGISYTLGVVFYSWRQLPYHHAIWHLFVIGGTIGHFWAIAAM